MDLDDDQPDPAYWPARDHVRVACPWCGSTQTSCILHTRGYGLAFLAKRCKYCRCPMSIEPHADGVRTKKSPQDTCYTFI